MAIYPMQCASNQCERIFDWHTKPALYMRSKGDEFRDCRCVVCGRLGASRIYPPDSAPADLTVRGRWGKNASPELRGKEYSSKGERDRQAAVAGSMVTDDGMARGTAKSSVVTTYTHDGDKVVEAPTKHTVREAVAAFLGENGETKLVEIINGTGIERKLVQDAIYSNRDLFISSRRGFYRLAPTPASA